MKHSTSLKHLGFGLLPLFSLMLSLTACHSNAGGPPSGNPMAMGGGVPVETTVLHEQPIPQSQDYQAVLISRRSVILKPQVSGQVSQINVKAGQHVNQGAALIQIDARKQTATLHSSQADAASYKAAIQQSQDLLHSTLIQESALRSGLDLNQKQYNRYQALYNKGAGSRQDFEKATDSLNQAKAQLQTGLAQIQAQHSAVIAAQKNYQKAAAGIQEQKVQLQYYRINAPFSGIVGDIPVKMGDYVDSTTPLLSVTNNQPLELNVNVSADHVTDLKNDLPVFIMDNQGHSLAQSNLYFISPMVDTNTQTILVKSNFQNADGLLKANQSVKARIIFRDAPGILIPVGAVSHYGGQDFAFLVLHQHGKASVKQQPIKLGAVQDNRFVVLSGLKAGDEIVAQGIQKLMDGAPITVLPAAGH